MTIKFDPVIGSEEHIRRFVHDFSVFDTRQHPQTYVVFWEGRAITAYTMRGLVERIIEVEGINNGI